MVTITHNGVIHFWMAISGAKDYQRMSSFVDHECVVLNVGVI